MNKNSTAALAQDGDIKYPARCKRLACEAGLSIVIGMKARFVPPAKSSRVTTCFGLVILDSQKIGNLSIRSFRKAPACLNIKTSYPLLLRIFQKLNSENQ